MTLHSSSFSLTHSLHLILNIKMSCESKHEKADDDEQEEDVAETSQSITQIFG